MNIEQIIFNILSKYPHSWIRYWIQKEISGLSMPGEYIAIRSSFLSGNDLLEIFEAGFKIESVLSKKIDQDAYCDILLMREINKE